MIRIMKIILSIVGISLVGLVTYEGINYKLAQLKAAERALVASNAVIKQASTLASFKAKEAAEAAAEAAARSGCESSG